MRDAFVITIILIALFLVIGYVYNVMSPYFVKLGVLENEKTPLIKNGGVFRSMDFGRSWTKAGGSGEDVIKHEVFNIYFDSKDPKNLLIATSGGLYKSADAGDSWRRFGSGLLQAGLPAMPTGRQAGRQGEGVTSFAQDPKNPERMYVASYFAGSENRGRILKSKGSEFYEVYSTISKDDNVLGVWVDSFDTSTLYAGTQSGFFLESRDFGESWKVKKEFREAVLDLIMLPSDTRILYAHVGGRVFKSQNQGLSWEDITKNLQTKYGVNFNVEQIMIYPHDEKRLYLATTHGLFRSDDGGSSFLQVQLIVMEQDRVITAIGLDPIVKDVLYIALDSQIHKSIDGGRSWQIKTLDTAGKISRIKIKPDDSSIIFVGVK